MLRHSVKIGTLICSFALSACSPSPDSSDAEVEAPQEAIAERGFEVFDQRFDALVRPGTEIEVLAEGFTWSEGPVWVEDGGYVLFSDVPENKIYKWSSPQARFAHLSTVRMIPSSVPSGAKT